MRAAFGAGATVAATVMACLGRISATPEVEQPRVVTDDPASVPVPLQSAAGGKIAVIAPRAEVQRVLPSPMTLPFRAGRAMRRAMTIR